MTAYTLCVRYCSSPDTSRLYRHLIRHDAVRFCNALQMQHLWLRLVIEIVKRQTQGEWLTHNYGMWNSILSYPTRK